MAQLVVRNLENSVKARLQRRARRNGRSMEEEVRDILRARRPQRRKGNPNSALATEFGGLVLPTLVLMSQFKNFRGFEIKPPTFEE